MDISTVKNLCLYNYRVNDSVNDILMKLTEEQWGSEFGGFYQSIKDVCTHLAVTDYAWMKRFTGLRTFSYSASPVMVLSLEELSSGCSNVYGYGEIRQQLDSCFLKLSEELTEEDLAGTLAFTRLNGDIMSKPVDKILLHLSHHQTHHRGMVALYLDMLNIENDFSNLLNQI